MDNSFMLALWIIIALVTLIMDIATSAFLFMWFTMGAVLSMIALAAGASPLTQAVLFGLSSTILMGIGYPIVKKTIKKTVKKTATMEESYIGRIMTLMEDVDEKALIKVDGIYWTVKNVDGIIRKGEKIQIVGIDGNKLLIKRLGENK